MSALDKLKPRSLRGENAPALTALLSANILVFGGLVTTHVLTLPALEGLIQKAEAAAPSLLGAIVCGVLNWTLTATAKARLIWWRWRYPMPGSRAFTGLGPRDPRVDMERLKKKLGKLPTDPAEQNRMWFNKLYRPIESQPLVLSIHKAFLFHRDYTALAFVSLFVFGPIALYTLSLSRSSEIYFSVLAGQYLLARQAAANSGDRLVTTVMSRSY